MEHLGDITQLKGNEIPKVDIITGGSPCQDLSVAGKREGLAGERSGLFMEQIRIIKEMREDDRANGRSAEHIRPRFMVWENVPGAFSSNKGEDFRCALEETAKIADSNATIPRLKEDRNGKQKWSKAGAILGDGWSIAWRVHDAQFWGVPQRRKRISLVADFAGGAATEILFEPKSLYGNTETSREEGKGTTTDAERSTGETSAIVFEPGDASRVGGHIYENKAGSLRANTGDNQQAVVYRKKGHPQNAEQGQGWEQTETNDTLNAFDNGESRTPTVVLENHPNDSRVKIREDGKVQTLSSRMGTGGGNVPMVMESEKSASLRASGGVYGGGSESLSVNSVVRRLTPLEVERLQGFPDGWTDIGEWYDSKGKKHKDADSPRYKALGNSIALPFWEWMAKRMVKHINHEATMGSLFDGISGFCLVFLRAGAKPIFSSEIEEFPMAVAKKHFGDDDKGLEGDYEKYL